MSIQIQFECIWFQTNGLESFKSKIFPLTALVDVKSSPPMLVTYLNGHGMIQIVETASALYTEGHDPCFRNVPLEAVVLEGLQERDTGPSKRVPQLWI